MAGDLVTVTHHGKPLTVVDHAGIAADVYGGQWIETLVRDLAAATETRKWGDLVAAAFEVGWAAGAVAVRDARPGASVRPPSWVRAHLERASGTLE